MYFCRQFHNGRNVINKTKSEKADVLSFSLLPGFSILVLVNAHNLHVTYCGDVNLVDRKANLCFLKLVLFHFYLTFAWLKHNRKT